MGLGEFVSTLPQWRYWISGPALFLPLSFIVMLVLGAIPIMNGRGRWIAVILLGAGFVVAAFGWKVAAQQELNNDQLAHSLDSQSRKLDAAEVSNKAVRGQLADLIVSMNRMESRLPSSQPEDIAVLAAGTPEWVKVAYGERGQAEIPGPQENPRIVTYFKSIGAKENYRDDLDDWASAFAEWSLNQVGISGPKNDDPFAWLDWGEVLEKPQFGCIVVMSFSGLRHVGFYFGEDGDFVRVLGGNEDDAVRIFRYPKSSVFGYRAPSKQSPSKP